MIQFSGVNLAEGFQKIIPTVPFNTEEIRGKKGHKTEAGTTYSGTTDLTKDINKSMISKGWFWVDELGKSFFCVRFFISKVSWKIVYIEYRI